MLALLYRFEMQWDSRRLAHLLRASRHLGVPAVRLLCCRRLQASHCLAVLSDCLETRDAGRDAGDLEVCDAARSLLRDRTEEVLTAAVKDARTIGSLSRHLVKQVFVDSHLRCPPSLVQRFVTAWLAARAGSSGSAILLADKDVSADKVAEGVARELLLSPADHLDLVERISAVVTAATAGRGDAVKRAGKRMADGEKERAKRSKKPGDER